MPIIPLNPTYNNIKAFISSLFEPDVRAVETIEAVIKAGRFFGHFSPESDKILALWTAAWQAAHGDDYDAVDVEHCPASDRAMLTYLSQYIAQNKLAMFVPRLKQVAVSDNDMPIYELAGYQRQDLQMAGTQWNYETVGHFLSLLMSGAHFVVIHAEEDLPPGVSVTPLWRDFKENDAVETGERADMGNSHYTSSVNACGEYYPNVQGDVAPDDCPFILSLLVCPTVSSPLSHECAQIDRYNTFMQLEGWELTGALEAITKQGRHMADYATHEKTLWNISTYGFSAYSEKRATPIFLAPVGWDPRISADTLMPPYVGAESRQPWLNTTVVQLPADHWQVTVRSGCRPQADQQQRSSDDLEIKPPPGTQQLRWTILHADTPGNIRFELWQNVELGWDQPLSRDNLILSDLHHQSITPVVDPAGAYYIANPSGCPNAQGYFEVLVEAIG